MYALDEKLWFPPVDAAMEDGLLAFGGDLSTERLLLAYRNGIFPWYDGGIPLWWSPDPRCVIFPNEVRITKSMQQLLRKNAFEFRINENFEEVVRQCKQTIRPGQEGTWISDEIIAAYTALHRAGHAHCAAVYRDGVMVGGLYGLRINNVFCGESMFSKQSNASKYAFIRYAGYLLEQGVQLIDCQVHNPHLETLGAVMIPRSEFVAHLQQTIK